MKHRHLLVLAALNIGFLAACGNNPTITNPEQTSVNLIPNPGQANGTLRSQAIQDRIPNSDVSTWSRTNLQALSVAASTGLEPDGKLDQLF